MSAIDALLDGLPPWVLVGGKGGVGKTTCAAALALRSGERGSSTLLLSTDPAGALAEVLETPLRSEPTQVSGAPGLHAMQLDARVARDAFLRQWRSVLVTILDRGTYLDAHDIEGLVDSALPGADEAMATLTLAELTRSGRWQRVIVDTAPTGHTLRLLSLPETFRALVDLLDRMQEKHRFMVAALTHRYRTDEADRFLDHMRGELALLRATLQDGRRASALLVTRAEPMVVEETARYAAALDEIGIRVAGILVNAAPMRFDQDGAESLQRLERVAPATARWTVALTAGTGRGIPWLRAWSDSLGAGAPAVPDSPPCDRGPAAAGRPIAADAVLSLIRPLTIVAGKGGVGKTTTACALAIVAADAGQRVLLVSTDPAPSIGDALLEEIGDAEREVPGVSRLVARQMDAAAAFARLRDRYRERVDALFDAFAGGGLDASYDRAILRDLLDLAPPGIDEVYALASLGEAIDDERFDTIVVDPAPTGHLLRLLEMPALALEWSHRLMRLMLKYREVAGLGDAAEELLGFARRTRAVGAILADGARAGAVLVMLDEPVVRAESERLAGALAALGVEVTGALCNRAAPSCAPLPLFAGTPQFVTSAAASPPRGAAALRWWLSTWSSLEVVHG